MRKCLGRVVSRVRFPSGGALEGWLWTWAPNRPVGLPTRPGNKDRDKKTEKKKDERKKKKGYRLGRAASRGAITDLVIDSAGSPI